MALTNLNGATSYEQPQAPLAVPKMPAPKQAAPAPQPAPPQQAQPYDASGLGKVTTQFGQQTAGEPSHPGIDIANKGGTPVPSFTSGIVTQESNGNVRGSAGPGNFVVVTDFAGNQHRYSHMNKVWIPIGAPVQQGQPLGAMGSTGQTYSPSGGDPSNLDYRVMSRLGQYMNPSQFVQTQ